MRVIVPVVPEARLLSSSVPEPDAGWAAYSAGTVYSNGARASSGGRTYQSLQMGNLGNPLPVAPALRTDWWADVTEVAYNSGATYGLGDRVISTAWHRMYESLQINNVGKPLPVPPETETDWWLEVGTTNRYASVDAARNTQTIAASPLTLSISPGQRINSIAVMGMEADSLTITMVNAGSTVYSKTFDLRLRRVRNAYEYAFRPFDLQRSVVQFDLPPFFNATINLTLTRSTGIVKLGSVTVGNFVYLGRHLTDAENDSLNFSEINRDKYGTATLKPIRSLPVTTQTCLIEKRYVNDLLDARQLLDAVVAVYSGLDDRGSSDWFEAFLIQGVYKRFTINSRHSDTHALVSMQLEEI